MATGFVELRDAMEIAYNEGKRIAQKYGGLSLEYLWATLDDEPIAAVELARRRLLPGTFRRYFWSGMHDGRSS